MAAGSARLNAGPHGQHMTELPTTVVTTVKTGKGKKRVNMSPLIILPLLLECTAVSSNSL